LQHVKSPVAGPGFFYFTRRVLEALYGLLGEMQFGQRRADRVECG
jgi:hypothetical protein